MSEMGGSRLIGASEEILRETIETLAQRVAELEARALEVGEPPRSLGFSDDKLATIAMSIYRSRQRRALYFGAALFGEPAWDMLLDLFIAKVRGARVSTTSLCLSANVPQATGLRWVGMIVKAELARRYRAPDDARLKLVEITPEGFRLMRRCVSENVTRFEMPLPD
jgi:hypothetical protein